MVKSIGVERDETAETITVTSKHGKREQSLTLSVEEWESIAIYLP
jgi:hypothetical protein